ncbi:hypothetical protein [uncultured Paludibaculum sp.]|uniref:hypothetical protein n=1 Tax=uncultured Paludibaculum sp. TaxID=1765020 RepID=UPI002AAAF6C5|nr:hypothetical protein [uncultured Paludibaculum sp.]
MKTTIEPPHSRRFTRTTTAENELLLGEDALSLITCVEDRQLFAGVRDSVHQQFAPRTLYEQNRADSIAEDLWRKSRFSTTETAALSATAPPDCATHQVLFKGPGNGPRRCPSRAILLRSKGPCGVGT